MYKFSTKILYILLSACLFTACRSGLQSNEDALLQIGDLFLTRQELAAAMPENLSPADSAKFVDQYIHRWIGETLLYQQAEKNIPDLERIEALTEQYRRDLIVFEYRKRLLNERVDDMYSEQELQDYYNRHAARFRLKAPIVKGLFLKVPENTPDVAQLKKWYASSKPNAVENIEKYVLKNAVVYEYFYDKWIPFEEIANNIPYDFGDPATFLKGKTKLEINKEGYWYLLNLTEYSLAGEVQPYEFARTQIQEILINNNRLNFNRELEEELFRKAEDAGDIKWLYKQNESENEEERKK